MNEVAGLKLDLTFDPFEKGKRAVPIWSIQDRLLGFYLESLWRKMYVPTYSGWDFFSQETRNKARKYSDIWNMFCNYQKTQDMETFFMFDGSEFLGYFYTFFWERKRKTGDVGIFLLNEFQGLGFGYLAMLFLEKVAKSSGIDQMVAVVDPKNIHSQKLMNKTGLNPYDGELKDLLPSYAVEHYAGKNVFLKKLHVDYV